MNFWRTPEGRKQASDRMKAIIAARGGKTNFMLGKERQKKMPKRHQHWTQTPKGRKRMAEIQRMGAVQRKRTAAYARKNGVNGHATIDATTSAITIKKSARGFAKDAVKHLAIVGAKQRLLDIDREHQTLDRERDMLLIFIRSGEGAVKSGAEKGDA